MKKEENKEKAFSSISVKSFLSVMLILITLIAVCGILSLVIPQGVYQRGEDGFTCDGSRFTEW